MRILIISQHLFPMQTPRANRTTELVKEFSKQGHEVVVYAVLGRYDYHEFEQNYGVQVKNIPIKWMLHPYSSDDDRKRTLIDKISGRLFQKFEFPNIEFKYRISDLLIKDLAFDAIISIAAPHQIHWGVARFYKNNSHLRLPTWIADCGDPYVFNQDRKKIKRFEEEEHLFCQLSDYITVPFDNAKVGYFEQYWPKIKTIPQGFDFTEIPGFSYQENKVLTFGYAGNFYDDIRNPINFLEYISQFKMDFRFIVYSPYPDEVYKYRKILGDRLVVKQAIPRKELLIELARMDFLLNIENFNSPAQLPSKLIDYAITNRPILSINPQVLDEHIISQFFERNYDSAKNVSLDQFNIKSVVNKFCKLIE